MSLPQRGCLHTTQISLQSLAAVQVAHDGAHNLLVVATYCCRRDLREQAADFVHCISRLRVTEHNILVVAKYYSCIRMERLATLLDLSAADAEKHLSEMVIAANVTAKIDRPTGENCFSD